LIRHDGIVEYGSKIAFIRHTHCLHHRQAVPLTHLRHAVGGFMAMQLQHVQGNRLNNRIQRLIIGINDKRHLGKTHRGGKGQESCLIKGQVARAFGKKHKTRIGRPG
jgi:hypothetical protein